MSPLLQTISNATARAYGLFTGGLKFIIDSFSRTATTAPNLGTSTGGQAWTTVSGMWYVNSSHQAENDEAGSSYGIAGYDVGSTTQFAYASISPGMGVSFWTLNNSNWWSVVGYDQNIGPNCYTCADNCASNCSTCGGITYNSCQDTQPCTSCGATGSTKNGCATPGNCPGAGTNCVYVSQGANNTTGCSSTQGPCYYNCCLSCVHSACGCASCASCGNCALCGSYYLYYHFLYLINNVGGVKSNYGSLALSAAASAVAVQTETGNNNINYAAYGVTLSGTYTNLPSLVSVLGSGVYTATSPTKGTLVGMSKSASLSNQGATISGYYGIGL